MNAATLWTIDELGAQVALALSVDYDGAGSGRVRDVPDRRTIRYYTTLGLIDRPAEMRGRTALYGRRHLFQLVAIKRLQAKGRSLAELQAEMIGRSNVQLQRIAKLPESVDFRSANDRDEEAPATDEPDRRRSSFWSESPTPVAEQDNTPEPILQGVALPDGVTLLVPAIRGIEPDDLEAIRAAAEPLLKILARRRLVRPSTERGPS